MSIFATVFVTAAAALLGFCIGRHYGPWRRFVVYAIAVMLAGSFVLASPQEALAISVEYVRGLDPKVAAYTRLLDLTHFDAEQRQAWGRILSFHCNSLSRETFIAAPRPVAGGCVLAINLKDYGIDPAVWERLASVEPYFTQRFDVTEPYPPRLRQGDRELVWNGTEWVYSQDGKLWYKAVPQPAAPPAPGQPVRKNITAPWLDPVTALDLVTRTQSQVPVVRGDWFLFETAIQENRVAGYYDFLGLGKSIKDFDGLIGANAKLARERHWQMAASVARSGVAINNRGVQRDLAQSGARWATNDFIKGVDRQNVVRVLSGDTEPPHGDAQELYGTLPNGLPVVFLANAQGVRQDSVPPNIAPRDTTAPGNDCRIHPYLSCVRCHVEGLRPIRDWVREVYKIPLEVMFKSRLELRSPSYEKLAELRNLYFTDLEFALDTDRRVYANSTRLASGYTLAQNAKALGVAWERYAEWDVTRADMAVWIGCTEEKLAAALKAYGSREAVVDPVLAAYLKDPPLPIRVEHAEEVFPLVQLVVGNIPGQGVK